MKTAAFFYLLFSTSFYFCFFQVFYFKYSFSYVPWKEISQNNHPGIFWRYRYGIFPA